MPNSDEHLLQALATRTPVNGYTHNFYRYPARFSPLLVREVIRQFSRPGDLIFDPFMGGGTTIVEALAEGRRALGVDLNSLAVFVSLVKTSPLTRQDHGLIREWLDDVVQHKRRRVAGAVEPVRNLPRSARELLGDLSEQATWLPFERQRRFLRCALLRTGQWALDREKRMAPRAEFLPEFSRNVTEMLNGMSEFITRCAASGLRKHAIRGARSLLCRSAIGLEDDKGILDSDAPRLIITSPPYPGVHILYHRWQVEGRRETPAPYWIAALQDGHFASHYTFGSRSGLGLENYFRNLVQAFASIRKIVDKKTIVVQLVAFSNADEQLPRYLEAMEQAGFRESQLVAAAGQDRLWRNVPNRRWYCHSGKGHDSAKEVALFHKPC
jgi:hypothetical protein